MTSCCIILHDIRRAVGAQKRRRETVDFFQLHDRFFVISLKFRFDKQ